MLDKEIKQLFKDFENYDLPKNIDNVDKIQCSLESGKRIYWYYQEDKDFSIKEGWNIEEQYDDIYSGIIVPIPFIENNGGEFDFDEVMVCIDRYPCEKDYPAISWVSLNRLLDNNDLVKIFEKQMQ